MKWNSIWFKIERKTADHDHIPFNLKGKGNIVFSVCTLEIAARTWILSGFYLKFAAKPFRKYGIFVHSFGIKSVPI